MVRRLPLALVPCLLFAVWTMALPASAQETGGGLKANLDLPFDAGARDGDEESTPEAMVFYGQIFEGNAFVFCCEKVSGCDGGVVFRRIQKEVTKTLSAFSERVEFGIVLFDTSVSRFPSAGSPVQAVPVQKSGAISWLKAAQPGVGSCAEPALLSSLRMAELSSSAWKRIIFLGEGYNWCPGTEQPGYSEKVLQTVRQKNQLRIPIDAMGVSPGHEANAIWLRRLASENSGTYTLIPQ